MTDDKTGNAPKSDKPKMNEPKSKNPVRMKVQVDETTARGVYSNTAMVHNNELEFVLDFLFAEPQGAKGHIVSRVITNPKAAKRLSVGLSELIKRYEERFGEITLPKAPSGEPGKYH